MTIDTAQFISELIISGQGSPEGTEPISEGDNQIVTVKRATQQSFPFVDKEVSRSADELNDIVTKSDAQTITAVKTHEDNIIMANDKAYRGQNVDLSSGVLITMDPTDVVRVGSNANPLRLSGGAMESAAAHQFIEGTANTPGIRGSQPDDGMSIGNGQIIISTSGLKRLTISDGGISSDVRFEIEAWEMFAANFISGTTRVPEFSTPNAAAWTATESGNVLTVVHNFGHQNYIVQALMTLRGDVQLDARNDNNFTISTVPATNIIDLSVMRGPP